MTHILCRDLTPSALNAYFESEPELAGLKDQLESGVDANLLIDCAIANGKAGATVAILRPCFVEGVEAGALQRLALRVNAFLKAEADHAKAEKKACRYGLSEEQQGRCREAMARERQQAVGPAAVGTIFEANGAAAVASGTDRLKAKRERYERDGCVFTATISGSPQEHEQYILDNLPAILLDMAPHPPLLGGKMLSTQCVFKKGKAPGAKAEVCRCCARPTLSTRALCTLPARGTDPAVRCAEKIRVPDLGARRRAQARVR